MSTAVRSSGRVHADPIPNIRAAGHIIAFGGETADLCLKGDYNQQGAAPGTPEYIKKYRKSFQN